MSDMTLESLDSKIDALGNRLDAKIDTLGARLDKKIDDGFAKAFEQTQGGFDEHRKFTEFVVERSAKILRTEMNRRFDGMDDRFNRLEKLITDRALAPGKRSRPGR